VPLKHCDKNSSSSFCRRIPSLIDVARGLKNNLSPRLDHLRRDRNRHRRGEGFMYQDDDQFPIKCDSCREEFFEKIGRIKTGQVSICPGCGIRISHPAEQFTLIMGDQSGDARRDYLRRFLRLANLK